MIIAEDITSRFLNVISLFNSAMPMIAVQIVAAVSRVPFRPASTPLSEYSSGRSPVSCTTLASSRFGFSQPISTVTVV